MRHDARWPVGPWLVSTIDSSSKSSFRFSLQWLNHLLSVGMCIKSMRMIIEFTSNNCCSRWFSAKTFAAVDSAAAIWILRFSFSAVAFNRNNALIHHWLKELIRWFLALYTSSKRFKRWIIAIASGKLRSSIIETNWSNKLWIWWCNLSIDIRNMTFIKRLVTLADKHYHRKLDDNITMSTLNQRNAVLKTLCKGTTRLS